MINLDPTDQQLLALLRSNARISVVDLARQLSVSRATVQNRIKRLENNKIVLGYTVKVPPEIEQYPIRALMCIETGSRKEANVVTNLRGNPYVTSVHHTTGRWDLIIEIRADTLATFNNIVGEIRLIDGVSVTETNLLLDSYE
jgi:DNA-binding Lrp family transcriptional regulator